VSAGTDRPKGYKRVAGPLGLAKKGPCQLSSCRRVYKTCPATVAVRSRLL